MFNYFLIKYIEHIIFSRNNYIDIELPNLIFTEFFFFSPLSSSSSCLPLLFLLPLFFFFTLLALLFLHRSLLLSLSLSLSLHHSFASCFIIIYTLRNHAIYRSENPSLLSLNDISILLFFVKTFIFFSNSFSLSFSSRDPFHTDLSLYSYIHARYYTHTHAITTHHSRANTFILFYIVWRIHPLPPRFRFHRANHIHTLSLSLILSRIIANK